MNPLDQHIISSLTSLSNEGKELAKKELGPLRAAPKKRPDNTHAKRKMVKSLFK
jgi:hypothetical protein